MCIIWYSDCVPESASIGHAYSYLVDMGKIIIIVVTHVRRSCSE